MLTAIAGQDVAFDLRGVLRDPDIVNFIVNADSITAGRDIDVLLRGSLDETKVNPQGLGITVYSAATTLIPTPESPMVNPIDASFGNFFYPDSNKGIVVNLDPGAFADPNQASPITSTYNFRSLDA
jgi:hypothetical protein